MQTFKFVNPLQVLHAPHPVPQDDEFVAAPYDVAKTTKQAIKAI